MQVNNLISLFVGITSIFLFLFVHFHFVTVLDFPHYVNGQFMNTLKTLNHVRWPYTKEWNVTMELFEAQFKIIEEIASHNSNIFDYYHISQNTTRYDDNNVIYETINIGSYIAYLYNDNINKNGNKSVCIVTHLDSHFNTNGTSDNLIACVQSLYVLKHFAQFSDIKVGVLGLFTDSEEQGLNSMFGLLDIDLVLNCELFIILEAMGCAKSLPLITASEYSTSLLNIFQNKVPATVHSTNLIMDISKISRGTSTTESIIISNDKYGICTRRKCVNKGIPLLEVVYADDPYKYHTTYDNYECVTEKAALGRVSLLIDGISYLNEENNMDLLNDNLGSEYMINIGLEFSIVFHPIFTLLFIVLNTIVIIYFIYYMKLPYLTSLAGFGIYLLTFIIYLLVLFLIYYLISIIDPYMGQKGNVHMFAFLLIFPAICISSGYIEVLLRIKFEVKKISVDKTYYISFLILFDIIGIIFYALHYHLAGFFVLTTSFCLIKHLLFIKMRSMFNIFIILLIIINFWIHLENFISILNPLVHQYSRDRFFLAIIVYTFMSFLTFYSTFMSFFSYFKYLEVNYHRYLSLSGVIFLLLYIINATMPTFTIDRPLHVQIHTLEIQLKEYSRRGIFVSSTNKANNHLIEKNLHRIIGYSYRKHDNCYFNYARDPCYELIKPTISRIKSVPEISVPKVDVSFIDNIAHVDVQMTNALHDDDGGIMISYAYFEADNDFNYIINNTYMGKISPTKTGKTMSYRSIFSQVNNNVIFILDPISNKYINYRIFTVIRKHTDETKNIIEMFGSDIIEYSKSSYFGPQLTGVDSVIVF